MAKYGEMAWEDDDNGNGGGDKKNVKDQWLRLDPGSNPVRLVTRPHQYIVHKGVKKKGEKGFGQKVYCSNPDGTGSCPLCDMGLKAGRRWLLGVIDGKSHTYKLLDISWQVYSQIQNYARNTDVWGDPMKYDLNIIVNKAGGPTGYYSVQPVPHKPLNAADQKIKDEVDLDRLKFKVTPPTMETVQKRIDQLLEGEPVEMPPAKTDGKPAAKATGKAKPTPQIADEEDNVEDIFPSYDNDAAPNA